MSYADFPIVYNGITYMVDPFVFCYNSQRFRDLFHPGYAGFSQVTINGNFQPKSVDVFCSICQNHQVMVPQECYNDLATLSRIFVAEQAVSNYIGNVNANPNGSIIFENRKSINQAYDEFDWLNENGIYETSTQSNNFSFENQYSNSIASTPAPTFGQNDTNQFQSTQQTQNFYQQTTTTSQYQEQNTFNQGTSSFGQETANSFGQETTNSFGQETTNNFGQEQNNFIHEQSSFSQDQHNLNQYQERNGLDQNPNELPDQNQLPDSSQLPQSSSDYQSSPNPDGLSDPMPYYTQEPILYEVQVEKKLIKCNRYSLIKNGSVVASAKNRTGSIVLNVGCEAHFKQMDQSSGDIQRYSFLNIITCDGKKHEVKYFRDADTGYMTLHVIFYINNDKLLLTGLKKMPKEKIFGTLKVLDESHPCNLYLKNGRTAMTFTQTSKSTFNIECHLNVSMIFLFAIFMCAVTGPHTQFSSEFQGNE